MKDCELVEKVVETSIDEEYLDSLFFEYHSFNLWRTKVLSAIVIAMLVGGVIFANSTTVFFQ